MKFKHFLFPFIFFLVMQSISAQDFFPLESGHNWIYNFYENDSIINQKGSLSIGEVDTLIMPEGIVAYEFLQFSFDPDNPQDRTDLDTSYLYSLLSDLNVIYTAFDFDDVLDLDCNEIFKHSYTENDTFFCSSSDDFVSQYYGTYETLSGVVFEDCWIVFNAEIGEDSEFYFFGPDVGIVAFKEELDNEFPDVEIDTYNFMLSSTDQFLDANVTIFPNPSSREINMDLGDSEQPDRCVIFNVRGEVVYNESFNEARIDISNFGVGQYFIVGQKQNKFLWRKAFVKI